MNMMTDIDAISAVYFKHTRYNYMSEGNLNLSSSILFGRSFNLVFPNKTSWMHRKKCGVQVFIQYKEKLIVKKPEKQ